VTEGPGEETQALPVTPAHDTDSVQAPGWVLADRYRVLDRLGVGGMAEVFRAHDEQLDRDVAVKVFRTPVDEPGNAQAPERRETELRALAQLSHPNLITLYDANLAGPDPAFLVTELVIGPNLADRLTEGPLPEDLVRTIGIQVADALAYVHSNAMVHRDVKPANILLGTDGPDPETATIRARLSDFGIVRVIDGARMTAAEFTLGTASYIAPEQARGADVGTAADVYALGLVLIEMLTGVRSFDGPFHEALAARLVRAPDIPAGLPLPWPGLLVAMTALDPAQRPSAAQVADALRTSAAPAPLPPPAFAGPDDATVFTAPVALASAPMLAPPDSPPEEPRRSHRGAALAAAALAFVAVIATALVLLLKPSSHSPTSPQGGTTAPTTTTGKSGSNGSNGSSGSGQHGVPVTAGGGSGASGGASGPGASSGAPSSGATPSGASSTHSASRSATHFSGPPTLSTSTRPSSSSTSSRPSSSAPRSSTSRTTTAPPSSSPATSSSAAAGSGGPTSGSVAALPSGGP
jgi:serine/threonine protein kinase